MPLLYLALSCTILFFIYLLPQRIAVAIVIFAFGVGHQALSYFHYFLGGWEASGNTHPFNENLIFSIITLSFAATSLGFAAWLMHHRQRLFGMGWRAKLKTFAVVFAAFILLVVVLVVTVPLSFEMTVDLNLCDGSAKQPSYCQ